jgi:hypothetical protein
MRLQETIAFYLLMGAGVAVAMLLNTERRTVADKLFLALTASLFWPLYMPLLLSRPAAPSGVPADRSEPRDDMAAAIAQVNTELDAALSSLDGWVENVLESERGRLTELRTALVAHAARIRAMDMLLAGDSASAGTEPIAASVATGETCDRRRQSEAARSQNVARLAAVRAKSHDDLMATLAWIRELVSMIHLAKFTGAPASRAEELVAQIAAAVEGISAVAAGESTTQSDDRPVEMVTPDQSQFPLHSDKNRSLATWASSNAPAT